jgi:hypothetical protein
MKASIRDAWKNCVRHRKQLEIIKLFGTIDFDPAYDPKAERKSKRL